MPEVVDTPQRYVLHLMGCNDLSPFGADRSHAHVWLIHRIRIRAIPFHRTAKCKRNTDRDSITFHWYWP
ncbi:hypothetical protein M404DRAFT_1005156 [Pisolithus tinctorius Marx 270]|uniref:Uncharacterized protein n=1 Tax=Pisolithus tinctorius Marx 270 TaxID=870435 RepID=A0A0C3NTA6_PISTI|nr:hypothetical protein M404DRAFT_1005156 [Pisolithus tinctorius Marx 270]